MLLLLCFLHQTNYSGSFEIYLLCHFFLTLYPITNGIYYLLPIPFLHPLENWLMWTCLGLQGNKMTKITSRQYYKCNGLCRVPTVRWLVFKEHFWVWCQGPTANEASLGLSPPYAVVASSETVNWIKHLHTAKEFGVAHLGMRGRLTQLLQMIQKLCFPWLSLWPYFSLSLDELNCFVQYFICIAALFSRSASPSLGI